MKSIVTDDMKLLLTAKDAATVCGCTSRTWHMWNAIGYIPQPVYVGKSPFWRYKELEKWIAEGCPRRPDWVYLDKK